MRLSVLFALVLNLSWSWVYAADAPFESPFFSGTHFLQESKYEDAAKLFEEEYRKGNESAGLLYNWGLAAYKLKKVGLAVGIWRRALFTEPEMVGAQQALAFVIQEIPQTFQQDDLSLWSSFREHVLLRFGVNKFLAVLWLLLLPAGFLLIRYFGQRKVAFKMNSPLPPVPVIGAALMVLFCLQLLTTALKVVTLFETHATVVASPATLRTGPSTEDNSIFDLFEGFDVRVREAQNSWVLVSLPTGVSGWVQSEALFQHSGKAKLW